MWYVYKLDNFSLVTMCPLKADAKKKMKTSFEWDGGYIRHKIPKEKLGVVKLPTTDHFYTWAFLQKRH